ncbi:MAG TPA: hypothetical protein VFD27_11440 [Chthoniobacteraceae bacterium]|nr:hypothetical protein [Chthoniobacteraceae bacterium]
MRRNPAILVLALANALSLLLTPFYHMLLPFIDVNDVARANIRIVCTILGTAGSVLLVFARKKKVRSGQSRYR